MKREKTRLISITSFVVIFISQVFIPDVSGQQAGFVDLIGKDLSNWELKGGQGIFTLKDGIIEGKTPEGESPTSYFCTKKEYGDFELEFETRIDEGFNSGVQIRSRYMSEEDAARISASFGSMNPAGPPPGERRVGSPRDGEPGNPPRDPKTLQRDNPAANKPDEDRRGGGFGGPQIKPGTLWGPQVEIASGGSKGLSNSGYIFAENMIPKFWMSNQETMIAHDAFKSGQWNKYRIVAKGPRIQTWINGIQIEDLVSTEDFTTHPSGVIGLQLHFIQPGTGPFHVYFRNIKIKEL